MPGIGADPDYLHSFVTAGIDSLTGPGFSRKGSQLQATLHDYRQQNDGPYSFRRIDGIARQLIPILRGNWVIDLSVRASTTDADDGNEVPFFLMPDLGGGSDLRGYSQLSLPRSSFDSRDGRVSDGTSRNTWRWRSSTMRARWFRAKAISTSPASRVTSGSGCVSTHPRPPCCASRSRAASRACASSSVSARR